MVVFALHTMEAPAMKPMATTIKAYCAYCFAVKQDLFHYYQSIEPTPTGKTHAKCYICLRCLLQKVTYSPMETHHEETLP